MEINFKILSNLPISDKFISLGIYDFGEASLYVKNLAYKRNLNKGNSHCVFQDNGGTCSTKHTLLKNLAEENNFKNLKLMLGIFKMNSKNTPKINQVLVKYQLLEMPEAHNYLRYDNEIIDCTRRNSKPEDFIDDLITEIEISPNQIADFKVKYHKKFIQIYLQNNPKIPFSNLEFWKIREECIFALQK